MQQQKPKLLEIGIGLAVAGIAVKLALMLGALLNPFANLAVLAGVILIIIALVTPGRR